MIGVIAAAVAEVDPADKGNVADRAVAVPDDHELLVVGAAKADALIEEHLASRFVHQRAEVAVLLGAEPEPVRVRPPEQAFDGHAATHGVAEDGPDLRVGAVAEAFVRVAAPVGEQQLVAGTELGVGPGRCGQPQLSRTISSTGSTTSVARPAELILE